MEAVLSHGVFYLEPPCRNSDHFPSRSHKYIHQLRVRTGSHDMHPSRAECTETRVTFDSKAGGGVVVAYLPSGTLMWILLWACDGLSG